MSIERHYFPGNNTPCGFFSYYKYILGQREANKIICIKGGPGTGKSTFMKRIGKAFAEKGEDVDFLHCSADENSLDGIILKNRSAALIDGTSPHMTDPINPGAVDRIINLGDYWNEEGITSNKTEIIDFNEESSKWYRIAYNYLNAAKNVFKSLEEVYNCAIESSEIYRLVADIITKEYRECEISLRPGRVKKFFAGAITANGTVNYLGSLLGSLEKIYMINVPVGYANRSFMDILAEGAIYRGLDLETFYCSMLPDEKIEHIVIPQLKLGFITLNEYHDLEPWEIINTAGNAQEIILIDISDYMNPVVMEKNADLSENLRREFDILLNKTIKSLENAKVIHQKVEAMYVPNMNFTEIGNLCNEVIAELEKL